MRRREFITVVGAARFAAALVLAWLAFTMIGAAGDAPNAAIGGGVAWQWTQKQVAPYVIESGFVATLPSITLTGATNGELIVAAYLATSGGTYFLSSASGPIVSPQPYRYKAELFVPMRRFIPLFGADPQHEFIFYVLAPDRHDSYIGQISGKASGWLTQKTLWEWTEPKLTRESFSSNLTLYKSDLYDPQYEIIVLLRDFEFKDGAFTFFKYNVTEVLQTVQSLGPTTTFPNISVEVALSKLPFRTSVLMTSAVRRANGEILEGNVHFVIPTAGPISAQIEREEAKVRELQEEVEHGRLVLRSLQSME